MLRAAEVVLSEERATIILENYKLGGVSHFLARVFRYLDGSSSQMLMLSKDPPELLSEPAVTWAHGHVEHGKTG